MLNLQTEFCVFTFTHFSESILNIDCRPLRKIEATRKNIDLIFKDREIVLKLLTDSP